MADLERRDVRLQVFVTPVMDDKISDVAELMGMTKNEIVRMAIGQLVLGYDTSIDMLKKTLVEEAKNGKK